jgi:hypothetical protein
MHHEDTKNTKGADKLDKMIRDRAVHAGRYLLGGSGAGNDE